MELRRLFTHEITVVAIGQLIGTSVMAGIFSLVEPFDISELLGCIAGGILAFTNFFLMSRFAIMAADKAEAQDITGGQQLIRLSYMGRMIGMALTLIALAKSGYFHPLALVVPLAFTRPILAIAEFSKTKGRKQA